MMSLLSRSATPWKTPIAVPVAGQTAGHRDARRKGRRDSLNQLAPVDLKTLGEDDDMRQAVIPQRAHQFRSGAEAVGRSGDADARATRCRCAEFERSDDEGVVRDLRPADLARRRAADDVGLGIRGDDFGERSSILADFPAAEGENEPGAGGVGGTIPSVVCGPASLLDLHRSDTATAANFRRIRRAPSFRWMRRFYSAARSLVYAVAEGMRTVAGEE